MFVFAQDMVHKGTREVPEVIVVQSPSNAGHEAADRDELIQCVRVRLIVACFKSSRGR